MPFDPAGELVFREFGEELRQLVPLRQQDIVVHGLDFRPAVRDEGARLRPGDEEPVLPFRLIHMPDLSVIKDGGKIHLQQAELFRPFR